MPIGHDIGCVEADAIRMWRSNNDIEQQLQAQVLHYGQPRKCVTTFDFCTHVSRTPLPKPERSRGLACERPLHY